MQSRHFLVGTGLLFQVLFGPNINSWLGTLDYYEDLVEQ